MDAEIAAKDVVALALGAIGSILGIFNFVRAISADRVKLIVTPKLAFPHPNGFLTLSDDERLHEVLARSKVPRIAIEVVNLSKFQVHIGELGLCDGTIKPHRAPIIEPLIDGGGKLPYALGARSALTVYSAEATALAYTFRRNTRAYVRTACNTTCYGASAALSAWSALHQ